MAALETVTSWAELRVAANAVDHGGVIEVNATSLTGALLSIGFNRSCTVRLADGITSCTVDMNAFTWQIIGRDDGVKQVIKFVGNFILDGASGSGNANALFYANATNSDVDIIVADMIARDNDVSGGSGFEFDANGFNMVAHCVNCSATGNTNDGFSTRSTVGAGKSILTLAKCTATGNLDEAVSPHDDSEIYIRGGTFSSPAGGQSVFANGTGGTTKIDIKNAALTHLGATATSAMFRAEDGCTITCDIGTGSATVNVSGGSGDYLCRTGGNGNITVKGDVTITSGGLVESATGATGTVILKDGTYTINGGQDAGIIRQDPDTVKCYGVTFDFSGMEVLKAIMSTDSTSTREFWDCKWVIGDWSNTSSPNQALFQANGGTLSFYRCWIEVTGSSGNTDNRYVLHANSGSLNVEGCVFHDFQNIGNTAGTSRNIIQIDAEAGACTVIHNTFNGLKATAHSDLRVIVISNDETTVYGNNIAGKFQLGIWISGGTYTADSGHNNIYDVTTDISGGTLKGGGDNYPDQDSDPKFVDKANGDLTLANDSPIKSDATRGSGAYLRQTHDLTVTRIPEEGGGFTSTPDVFVFEHGNTQSGYSRETLATLDIGAFVPDQASLVINAVPNTHWRFEKWSNETTETGSGTLNFIRDHDLSIEADFSPRVPGLKIIQGTGLYGVE